MESIGNTIGVTLPGQLTAMTPGAEPSAEQMKQLGTEFESVFLSMLLKEMRNSLDEGFFGSEGSDSFGGMFDLFIGQHLAKSNAIGIGDLLAQQYSKGQEYSKGQAAGDEGKPSTVSFSA